MILDTENLFSDLSFDKKYIKDLDDLEIATFLLKRIKSCLRQKSIETVEELRMDGEYTDERADEEIADIKAYKKMQELMEQVILKFF